MIFSNILVSIILKLIINQHGCLTQAPSHLQTAWILDVRPRIGPVVHNPYNPYITHIIPYGIYREREIDTIYIYTTFLLTHFLPSGCRNIAMENSPSIDSSNSFKMIMFHRFSIVMGQFTPMQLTFRPVTVGSGSPLLLRPCARPSISISTMALAEAMASVLGPRRPFEGMVKQWNSPRKMGYTYMG